MKHMTSGIARRYAALREITRVITRAITRNFERNWLTGVPAESPPSPRRRWRVFGGTRRVTSTEIILRKKISVLFIRFIDLEN